MKENSWNAIKETHKWFENKYPYLKLAKIEVWDSTGTSERVLTVRYDEWCREQKESENSK